MGIGLGIVSWETAGALVGPLGSETASLAASRGACHEIGTASGVVLGIVSPRIVLLKILAGEKAGPHEGKGGAPSALLSRVSALGETVGLGIAAGIVLGISMGIVAQGIVFEEADILPGLPLPSQGSDALLMVRVVCMGIADPGSVSRVNGDVPGSPFHGGFLGGAASFPGIVSLGIASSLGIAALVVVSWASACHGKGPVCMGIVSLGTVVETGQSP